MEKVANKTSGDMAHPKSKSQAISLYSSHVELDLIAPNSCRRHSRKGEYILEGGGAVELPVLDPHGWVLPAGQQLQLHLVGVGVDLTIDLLTGRVGGARTGQEAVSHLVGICRQQRHDAARGDQWRPWILLSNSHTSCVEGM